MTNFLFLLLKQTDFSDWQCQEDCFLGSLLVLEVWERVLNLERETEGTCPCYVAGNGVPFKLEDVWPEF